MPFFALFGAKTAIIYVFKKNLIDISEISENFL